ncbi:RNase P/RNase MRP subunit POP5 [Candidatus Nanobsidianus stetteri]|uniref:RNase P/RNase MRP subunit POP5 n=1 Tax=Nanobsidianus stetteri TaxID=1294122 RepID=R1G2E3_NANST|nr:RNase P/RNase MRP subunit POP5 [Candidatus Nanobsidianus stetteri]
MVILPKALKIKNRYILLDFFDEEKLKKDFIKYFGYINYYDLHLNKIEINKRIILAVNKKHLYKIIFLLYLQNIKNFKIFKTLKGAKSFLNIS